MIKREGTEKKEVGFKGVFLGIDDSGFHLSDIKTEEKEVLDFGDFRQFIGREVKFGMVETKKKTLEAE